MLEVVDGEDGARVVVNTHTHTHTHTARPHLMLQVVDGEDGARVVVNTVGSVLGSKVDRDEGCVPADHELTFTHFACKGLCFGRGNWQQGRQG